MKKNVIYLLIDGCNADYLGEKDYKKSPSPFLDELKKKSYSFENVYSSGPYTEAAMIELMAGYRCLDHNSFIKNLAYAKETIFEAMQRNGYTTYATIYDYADYMTFERGVDYRQVYSAPTYHSIYMGRIRFYAEMYKQNTLPEEKYQIMYDLMDDFFESYEAFLHAYLSNDKHVQGILKHSVHEKTEVETSLAGILKEKEIYLEDKYEYVLGLMEQGQQHSLFAYQFGSNFESTNEMNRVYQEVFQKYEKTVVKAKKSQIKGNRKHIGGYAKNALKAFNVVCKHAFDLQRKGMLTRERMADKLLMPALELSIYTDYLPKKILNSSTKAQDLKGTPCAKVIFDDFIDWYKNEYAHDQPFYSYLHIDDIHVNPIPYSYTEDQALLNTEFAYMKDYVDSLDSSYHGNIMYDLAIHHVDEKIRLFYEQLKECGALENTILIVTADHGYYYSYNQFRLDSIGNMFKENYHIPFIYHDTAASNGVMNDSFFAERDIPFTIVNQLGSNVDESWQGMDMFENNTGRPYILSEYPGRGSPDLESKELYFGCFDDAYKVCIKVHLTEEISDKHIVEIYDEKMDPFETKNLVNGSYEKEKVLGLYAKIEERFNELKRMYQM